MTRPRPPTAKKAFSSFFAFAKPQKTSPPFAGAAPSENADGRVNSELAWRRRTQRQKGAKSDRIVFPAFFRALRKYFLLAPPFQTTGGCRQPENVQQSQELGLIHAQFRRNQGCGRKGERRAIRRLILSQHLPSFISLSPSPSSKSLTAPPSTKRLLPPPPHNASRLISSSSHPQLLHALRAPTACLPPSPRVKKPSPPPPLVRSPSG